MRRYRHLLIPTIVGLVLATAVVVGDSALDAVKFTISVPAAAIVAEIVPVVILFLVVDGVGFLRRAKAAGRMPTGLWRVTFEVRRYAPAFGLLGGIGVVWGCVVAVADGAPLEGAGASNVLVTCACLSIATLGVIQDVLFGILDPEGWYGFQEQPKAETAQE
jgi:hypothetical protein